MTVAGNYYLRRRTLWKVRYSWRWRGRRWLLSSFLLKFSLLIDCRLLSFCVVYLLSAALHLALSSPTPPPWFLNLPATTPAPTSSIGPAISVRYATYSETSFYQYLKDRMVKRPCRKPSSWQVFWKSVQGNIHTRRRKVASWVSSGTTGGGSHGRRRPRKCRKSHRVRISVLANPKYHWRSSAALPLCSRRSGRVCLTASVA